MVSTHTRFLPLLCSASPRRRTLSRLGHNAPHPKRELLKLCARIGYTPH
jgi:hypothetical protein